MSEMRQRVVERFRSKFAKDVPPVHKWVDELVVEDYPYGQYTTKARFFIEKGGRGERAGRITIDPKTNRPNKPKYTTYATAAKIGVGSDGRTYIMLGSPGQISFMAGDMKYSVGHGVFTNDPEYQELAHILGFKSGPGKIQVKRVPGGAVIDGLQGVETTIRGILQTAEMTPEEIEAVDKVTRKDQITHEEWVVTFKDDRPKFVIKVKS